MRTYILQIDTATEICSVSLSLDGVLVDCIDAIEPNLHASKLTVFIEDLLQRNSLLFSDLSAISVSKGPGSYTGLRIGVSTAKGLCYALDIPLLAVNTLESMLQGYMSDNSLLVDTIYVPMLDARRMEVYMAVYDDQSTCLQPTDAVIIDENSFVSYQGKKIIVFGSGASKLASLFVDHEHFHIDAMYRHSSRYLSQISFNKFEKKDFEDLIYFEPYYLKEFVATTPKKPLL